MSDQKRLIQKTLLDQMEKLLSKTEDKGKIQAGQQQTQVKDKTNEKRENLSSTKPVRNLDLGNGVPTIHNVTNDASTCRGLSKKPIIVSTS